MGVLGCTEEAVWGMDGLVNQRSGRPLWVMTGARGYENCLGGAPTLRASEGQEDSGEGEGTHGRAAQRLVLTWECCRGWG